MIIRGFTLIEMVVVIVITGIIAGIVAVFIKLPVQGYVDSARRADMTDVADAALRRMSRDLRLALPNSVRTTDSNATLELLLTRTGGRYRTTPSTAAATDFLDFTQPISTFNFYGQPLSGSGQTIIANDVLVVYNLGTGILDAYATTNSAVISATPTLAASPPLEYKINFASKQFPYDSPGARFQVVEGPVSYVCDTAAKTLTRYWGYAITPAEQSRSALAASGANRALVAKNVSVCVFDYVPGATARNGVVALTLKLQDSIGESVQLYNEVHVTNVP